ncbi:MAG: molybdate ABC transporter substrate-binding protein [Actinobacteria bacterium]|nr:molybdate ABC transporter substrate-binding protein [Actinomycetota bacterium]
MRKIGGHAMRNSLIRARAAIIAVLVVALLGAAGATAKSNRMAAGITVYAGSSMTSVLPAIDGTNTYSFGSSTTLATQITNGAPADVFMSANTTSPASLYAAGVVQKPVNFIKNTLAVVVPKSNPANIQTIYDLVKPGIKIAEAASSVPVGSYTVQVLKQMNLNDQVQANVVTQETSDANVVAKVATGQVDAGFVYTSDYVIDPKELTLIKVPAWAQPKATYALAIVTKSGNQAAAQAFVNKVLSPAGQAIFKQYGFIPIATPTPTVTAVIPAAVKKGGTVTFRGTNLATTTSVTFGGVPAKFKVVSATKLTVTVPTKAKSGMVAVTTTAGNTTATVKLS